jgi:hypothetical protein
VLRRCVRALEEKAERDEEMKGGATRQIFLIIY